MRRSRPSLRTIVVAFLLLLAASVPASRAHAALRAPQVPVSGNGLQSLMDGWQASLDVRTQQESDSVWVVGLPLNINTFSMLFELAAGAPASRFGIALGPASSPALCPIFDAADPVGTIAAVVIRRDRDLRVSRFNERGELLGTYARTGLDMTSFGFYLQNAEGVFWTQDQRNPGGIPLALFFGFISPDGLYRSDAWLCFEDSALPGADRDFDDLVVNVTQPSDSVDPSATTTWGRIKLLLR